MESASGSKFERKILKVDENAKRDVEKFEFKSLLKKTTSVYITPTLGGGTRSSTKDAPAEGDAEAPIEENLVAHKKENRFRIDPVIKDLLTYDETEESEIKNRVESEIKRLKDAAEAEAKESGYKAGFSEGEQKAKADFEVKAKSELEKISQFVASVESLKSEIFSAQEQFLLNVIFHITQNIIHREVSQDKEYVARLVRGVIEKVGTREQVKVWVHPSQIELIKSLVPELEKKFSDLKSISIESNAQLEAFDAVIETDWNRVDATLKTQLETMQGLLQEAVTAPEEVCVIPTKKTE